MNLFSRKNNLLPKILNSNKKRKADEELAEEVIDHGDAEDHISSSSDGTTLATATSAVISKEVSPSGLSDKPASTEATELEHSKPTIRYENQEN